VIEKTVPLLLNLIKLISESNIKAELRNLNQLPQVVTQ